MVCQHTKIELEPQLVHHPNPHGQDTEFTATVEVCQTCGGYKDMYGSWNMENCQHIHVSYDDKYEEAICNDCEFEVSRGLYYLRLEHEWS